MRILLIDQLGNENKYRSDFWIANRDSFLRTKIEIPKAINGNFVKRILDNGVFEPIDLTDFDLIIIHERDDRNTGYEGAAQRLGKKIIVYSDSFDETPVYDELKDILKIKGSLLYSRLADFFQNIEINDRIDFVILHQYNEIMEALLKPFSNTLPLEEYWDGEMCEKKKALHQYLKLSLFNFKCK